MKDSSIEMSLLDDEMREEIDFIWNLIPEIDKKNHTKDDVLTVLDLMDDYLEEVGLLTTDPNAGEVTYLDGEVDETEQMEYVQRITKEEGEPLSQEWIQLVMDGEMQYGIQEGWYSEDE